MIAKIAVIGSALGAQRAGPDVLLQVLRERTAIEMGNVGPDGACKPWLFVLAEIEVLQ